MKLKHFKESLTSYEINYDANVEKMEIPNHYLETNNAMSDENIPMTIMDMVLALHQRRPVLALVPAYVVGMSSHHLVAITIWGIQKGRYVCTNTFGTQIMTFEPHFFNRKIEGVWVL